MPQPSFDLELLKLRFAGYSTQQIHLLLKCFPHFLESSSIEKMTKLRQFNAISQSRFIRTYYDCYLSLKIEPILNYLKHHQIEVVSIYSMHYPVLLKEIYDPPLILFCKGNHNLLQNNSFLSVVGSRQATTYTQQALSSLFAHFPTTLTIVSGLANGADSMAHQTAIDNDLPTIGVLAFGHLHHYPKSNFALRQQIEVNNLTISEYLPEEAPKKYKFPERNRIISGLSQGVLITESKERSGAQITIDAALQQNRNVYVLPGTMFQQLTKGNLKRAQEGAAIVLEAKDILTDYGLEM